MTIADLYTALSKLDERKRLQGRRLDILLDNGEPHLLTEISNRFEDPHKRQVLITFLDQSYNALKAIVHRLAQVYRKSPRRWFDDAADTALMTAIVDPAIDQVMEQVNRVFLASNECFVRPVLRHGAVELDIIAPHTIEVLWEGATPTAALYKVSGDMLAYCDADTEALLDSKGNVIDKHPNPIGQFPLVLYRREHPVSGGWLGTVGEDLYDVYIDAVLFSTWANIVAWLQSHRLLARKPVDTAAAGYMGSPKLEIPSGPHQILDGDYTVLNLMSDLTPLLEGRARKIEATASVYGISPDVLSEAKATSAAERELAQIGLNEARESQVKSVRASDLRLMRLIAAVWNASSGSQQRFTGSQPHIDYTEPRRIATPLDEVLLLKQQVELGVSSPVEFLLGQDPDLTREQAQERIDRNLKEIARVLESRRRFGLPDTAAVAYGTVGGIASGLARRGETQE